ncbi:hypothetical protein Deba_1639 [Desulfarculus baarsii DSM 2075]|uniref:Uncharacterized protein n=1 Tax=Desulfarculus baarsii (strain ATCC 33931 / DSM 2075 / LMG 7858 / VKM B-1802 / 2st14) TaxID=644282 RepID=E1QHG4_DESB2|nr:hypothetical protein [Desulfarculus baarsii]ADK85007.1 hypothetical protein Deba_1639 [Desulfarculus baarsii DSM 2075]
MREVDVYTSCLLPELDDGLIVPETVSRMAYFRQGIADVWDELTAEERALVAASDAVLIDAADKVAEFWRVDSVASIRERDQPPKEAWWWWLHEIAEGAFPAELLPKAARP